ncbi:MAG: CYTH domain-containing protein [Opitutales bacterium]
MAQEIERKFLAEAEGWSATSQVRLRQGYLPSAGGVAVRVRLRGEDEAFLTLKGGGAARRRAEFDYAIPRTDGEAMLAQFCGDRVVEKIRHYVPAGDLTWEVDVFTGRHAGLVLAEIELPTESTEFVRPAWLGEEVTEDPDYGNYALAVAENLPERPPSPC